MPKKTDFKTHEEYLNYYRQYRIANLEKMKEYRKRWRLKTDRKNWDKENPLARRAHGIVDRAMKNGLLEKQPCEVCGTLQYIKAHHDDYNKPLQVRWLCETHHRRFHRELRKKVIPSQSTLAI